MIRVFLLHEDPVALERLREALGGAADISVVGQAADAGQALAALRTQPVDVIVMALPVPPEAEPQESADHPHARVPLVVFVPSPGCADGGHLGLGGAAGYLCADAAALNLSAAVRAVHAGESYVCPYLAAGQGQVRHQGHTANPRLDRLTRRELEILRQLVSGKPNRKIALALGLSTKTISAHRMHILAKLGLHSNIELARLAFEEGLLDD
jgi:DNA-binding NarL/FixJ family response regulator